MLTPDLKNELAKALATSALGYANMSKNDPSLSINLSLLNSGNRRSPSAPREASGPLRKRKLVAISGDDRTTGNMNTSSTHPSNDALPNMVPLPTPSSYALHTGGNNEEKRMIAKNFYTTNTTTTRGFSSMNKTIIHDVQSASANDINFEYTGQVDNKKNNDTIVDTGKLDNESIIRKARETRLEQNRIAARKSRMRKKTMIHNFHNSIMYYTHANAALKQENESLESMLKAAQEFIRDNKLSPTESSQEPNTIEADSIRVNTPETPSNISLVLMQEKSSPQGRRNICRTRNDVTVNEKKDLAKVARLSTELNLHATKPKTETKNAQENRISDATTEHVETPDTNVSSKSNKKTHIQQDITFINPNIIPSINSTVKAKTNDGNEESNKTPVVLSPVVTQNQNHQIAAAAACAANLQIAAANFQAALVASMGNPLLSQIDPTLMQNANAAPQIPLSPSTVIPYQNLSFYLPFLTGSSINSSSGVPTAGLSNNLTTFANMTYNQQNAIQHLQQNHVQGHLQLLNSTCFSNNDQVGLNSVPTKFGDGEKTINKHMVGTSPTSPAIVVTSDQDENMVPSNVRKQRSSSTSHMNVVM